ncbi:heme ABC transporter ATP-binding protein [Testudinibacter sp. P27/CKL/0425]
MLILKNLSLQIAHKRLLSSINLQLCAGQTVAILGANGAGKSTLLKAIMQDLPSHGELNWQQQDLRHLSIAERAKQLACLPQQSQLNFAFCVTEIMAMGFATVMPEKTRAEQLMAAALTIFDLQHLANQNYLYLSGGEKQRVHAARIWLQIQASEQPKLVLLDEPTSALDLKHQHQLLQQTNALAEQGHLILLVLHDLNLAARYCDRIILLDKGRIFNIGTPKSVLTTDQIEAVYGYRAEVKEEQGRLHIW